MCCCSRSRCSGRTSRAGSLKGGLTVPYADWYCADRAWRKVSSKLKQAAIEKR
jgi:hypothetical protein